MRGERWCIVGKRAESGTRGEVAYDVECAWIILWFFSKPPPGSLLTHPAAIRNTQHPPPVSPRLPREPSWLSDLLKSTGGLCWVSSLAVKGRLILHSCRPCFSSTQYHHAVRRRPLARLEKRLQSLIQQSRNRQVAQPTHKQTMSRLSIRGFVWV